MVKKFTGHENYVWCLCIVNENQFLSGSADKTIRLWNVKEGNCERVFTGHPDCVRSIKLLDNDEFISCSDDGTLILWNLKKENYESIRQVKPENSIQNADEEAKKSVRCLVLTSTKEIFISRNNEIQVLREKAN